MNIYSDWEKKSEQLEPCGFRTLFFWTLFRKFTQNVSWRQPGFPSPPHRTQRFPALTGAHSALSSGTNLPLSPRAFLRKQCSAKPRNEEAQNPKQESSAFHGVVARGLRASGGTPRRITSPREWGPIGDVSKRERNQTGYSSFNSTERNFTILTKFEQELVMSTQKPKQLKKMKQSLTSRLRRRWYVKGSVKIMAYHMAQLWIIFIKS